MLVRNATAFTTRFTSAGVDDGDAGVELDRRTSRVLSAKVMMLLSRLAVLCIPIIKTSAFTTGSESLPAP